MKRVPFISNKKSVSSKQKAEIQKFVETNEQINTFFEHIMSKYSLDQVEEDTLNTISEHLDNVTSLLLKVK
ncbi:hypothetical protein ABE55_00010 [Bacillus thuringiensis]|uniref:hypothetical protein n=1 Tax=Bacillales TaxID=1385 RepID=UPI000DE3B93E|nr:MULTISPECIES: hypothetical protein [Bacillales]MBG9464983.1 hypothetical protein [Bacillus thuringiensis]MBX0351815.1 hypothetical protein [Bacillus toyonensis]MDA1786664.1 hypothetical protein [Bacillus cereus]MDA2191600.1 hypothetical protein [Bacillus cereus]MDA2208566.1 hypothetical protein [Bacillus cereus]